MNRDTTSKPEEATRPRPGAHHPYDITIKELIDRYPGDWVAFLELDAYGPAELGNVELSTIEVRTDRVFRFRLPFPWVLNFDAQAGNDPRLQPRVLMYNAIEHHRSQLLVRSVVLLLRPQADRPEFTGSYGYGVEAPDELHVRIWFIRVWEIPVDAVLQAGLGVLPLATLCAGGEVLEAVIQEMAKRINNPDVPYAEAGELWGKTYFLAGIRHEQPRIERTLLAMRGIEESSTYQFVTRRSALNEARKLVLALGTDLLGESDAAVQSRLHAIGDLSVLEQIHLRILRVKSWDELQLPPATGAATM